MSDEIVRAVMPGRLLAADGEGNTARVRAVVSAYGVKYRIGYALWHTIEMGAFAASIAEQPAIPLFWMHSWDWSEQTPIGHSEATEESDSDGGLVIDGPLYADLDPSVARLHRAMAADAIREWSIGYRVIASRQDPDDEMHQIVTEAELLEASSVLRGANPETRTLEVAKAHAAAAGARTRLEIGDLAIETIDPDLISRLLTGASAAGTTSSTTPSDHETPETPAAEPRIASSWAANRKLRQMFGDALAG